MTNNNHRHRHQLEPPEVLLVPFPLQGHLNQLLHLARLISARGLQVHFVGTSAHNRQARSRIHGWDPESSTCSLNSTIHFHDLPPLTFDPDYSQPVTIDSQSQLLHIQPMYEAIPTLREPLRRIMNRLCRDRRRVAIIHDSLMGSVIQNFVELSNAEAYTFHSVSAYTMFFFLWENMGRPFEVDGELLEDLPSIDGCFDPEFAKFISSQHEYTRLNSGRIYNTCKVLESTFLDLLGRPEITGDKKQWAIGPFNPVNTKTPPSADGCSPSRRRHECLKWLDKQEGISSVILVSFGTTSTFSDEQIRELAIGLESSQQKFIWVLRNADKLNEGDHDDDEQRIIRRVVLPLGFDERVKGRGMIVVNEWAPQLEILGHPCVGGFMSHCGWNSCMESISMGVPIVAWPMHSDQPRNAVLVTKLLSVGILVRTWENRNKLVKSCRIESVVRKLMASEEGAEMRRRAAELGCRVREEEGGGGTRSELESFVSHVTRF